MFTAVIIFNLIAPGAPGLAGIPQQIASLPMVEDKCQEVLADQMNRLRTGLETKFGKGALLITGGCFSGVTRGPDGSIFFKDIKPEAPNGEGETAPEPKNFQ